MNNNITRILLLIGLVLYVASPVDCVPGPIDDAILMLMYLGMSRRKTRIPGMTREKTLSQESQ